MLLKIEGLPVPWRAHAGFGRKSFNPRFKEKEFYQWQIRSQWNKKGPFGGPIHLEVVYHLPIPQGTSKAKRLQMLNGLIHHLKRPDLDNLDKFLCDCLKTIVFDDDSQVVEKHVTKIYSETPQTVVKINTPSPMGLKNFYFPFGETIPGFIDGFNATPKT